MFNLRRLLAGAVDLPATNILDAENFAQQTINKVRGRVVRARGPNISGQPTLHLSQDAAALEVISSIRPGPF
jgi:hypothetical protein